MSTKKENPRKNDYLSPHNNGGIYEIKVRGLLDDHWAEWFEGMTLRKQGNTEAEQDCTIILGPIADQPALHGLLAKIRDLNLTLISVRKLDPKEPSGQERHQSDAHIKSSGKEHS